MLSWELGPHGGGQGTGMGTNLHFRHGRKGLVHCSRKRIKKGFPNKGSTVKGCGERNPGLQVCF